MKLLKYIVVIVLFLSVGKNVTAQIDTTFWFAAPWVTPDHDGNVQMAYRISTFNNPANVRIQQPASLYDTTFVVPANTLSSIPLDYLVDSLESKPADSVLNCGFKITSDELITVVYDFISDTVTISPGTTNNPETYSLKGQNGMGTEFVTPFQTLWNNQNQGTDRNGDGTITQPKQYFSIVATEDNTTVYITPRAAVVGHPAGVTYSVFLPNAGNVYTCQNVTLATSVPGNNLSGSIVVSDKPVSVTVNDDSVNPSGGGGCFDLMGDQIVPTDVIGNEYIINKGFLNAGSNESVFVVAVENFTTVTVNNGVTTTSVMINQGDSYQYSIDQQLTYINTDKPVYVLHMSGYGCELGEAIIPPLNCAGSNEVSFARSNDFSFLLDILTPAGTEGNFTLNGSTTLVPASAFNPVPGTGGAWMGAQISFSLAQISVGTANTISNPSAFFSMGVINGGSTTGCLYHYMSSFIRRVYTKAGNDTTLCNGDTAVFLTGSVTGGTTSGQWQVLNGSGSFANSTNLNTTYTPTSSDYAQGTLTFVLGSTGNCNPVYDTLVVDFIQSPVVDAGLDDIYCKNNLDTIPLTGLLQFATAASWSGGSGGSIGNAGDLVTTYLPSPTDIANDSVILYLTSQGSFFACPDIQDSVTFFFTEAPSVLAGADIVTCSNQDSLSLNGTVSSPFSGVWTTSGSGTFSPSDSVLNAYYHISPADTSSGFVTITLTSTDNGSCLAVTDSLSITILNKPDLNITTGDSLCSDVSVVNLTGTVTSGFSTIWTVNGFGTVSNPSSLNTTYSLSPLDTVGGTMQIILETVAGLCPAEFDTLDLTFVDPPQVFAGLDQEFCVNQPVALNGILSGSATGVSWSTSGTGTFNPSPNLLNTFYFPSAQDTTNGQVQLYLNSSADFGCTAALDTILVTFKAAPDANFTFVENCAFESVEFFDMSSTTDGVINSWQYFFGDTTTSIASDPIHTYLSSGTFNVTLVAGSSNGCFDTVTLPVNIYPVPIAMFTYNPICQGIEVDFLDNSFIASGGIIAWDWDFNLGSGTSNSQNASHIFPNSGTYPVTLTVTSDLGCVGTITEDVNVLSGPIANFSVNPNPALVLEDIFFNDLSTNGPISSWFWDFGDGTGGNNQNEIYQYANGGSYPVTLVVTDTAGCADTLVRFVNVALLPVVPTAFTPNGDGENDVFIIRGGPFESVDFKVYNNWGEMVFFTSDPLVGWDGTFDGAEAPLGVYTWTFEVRMAGDRVFIKEGDVTLIR